MQFLVLRLDNVHDVDDVANAGLLSVCHMDLIESHGFLKIY